MERLTEIDGDTMCCNSAFTRSRSGGGVQSPPQVTTENIVTGYYCGGGAGNDGEANDGGIVLSGSIVETASETNSAGVHMTEGLSQFMTPRELENQRAELARLKQQQQKQRHKRTNTGARRVAALSRENFGITHGA